MSNNLNNDEQRFSEIFKALSNPNRLSIFLKLVSCCCPGQSCSIDSDDETCATVGELGQETRIAPSTVSHHIKELYRCGLIRMERQGQQVKCWVDPAILRELADYFGGRIGNE